MKTIAKTISPLLNRPALKCRPFMALAFLSLAMLVATPGSAPAQFYFGQNKVQYTHFKWHVMTTDRFKIYYYEEEEFLASVAARIAEDSYDILARKFNHEIHNKIPLVIYSSHIYFTQTNTITGLISESTAGFTEFLKGRMVVPFTGSYYDFDHVIRHELTHVFTLSKLARVSKKRRNLILHRPPLWFIEGLAEFWSTKWNSQGEMMVRDMVINGRLLSIPQFYRIRGTFMMYKLGQSVCQFIHDEYGPEKLTMIFENWWKAKTFEGVVELTLGESLAQVSKKWEYSLRKKRLPLYGDRGLPDEESRQLTSDGVAVRGVPVRFDDGTGEREWIVYKANKLGYAGLYLMDARGEKHGSKTLVKGGRSADFESLHFLASGLDANEQGMVAFSAKSGGADALFMYDLSEGKVTKKYRFDEIASISSPRFSPDGQSVVFSGSAISGALDLYLLSLTTATLKRLTNDFYADLDPAYSVSGDSIYFASDRGSWGDDGSRDIYVLSLATNQISQLTSDRYVNGSPEVSDSGVYFVSNRDGVSNIYFVDNSDSVRQITRLLTGAFNPRLTTDGSELVYTGYQDSRFHLYNWTDTTSAADLEFSEFVTEPRANGAWRPALLSANTEKSTAPYNNDYSLDIAQSVASYDPVFGTLGGVQILVSDMLGDNLFYGIISNTARTKNDFVKSFNGGVNYLNLERRLNWGVGAFHLFNEYQNDVDGIFFERQVGVYGQISYPLSKFKRIETSLYLRYNDRDMFLRGTRRKGMLVSNFVSFVFDNSLWEPTGPIDGRRINLTLGLTTSLSDGRLYNSLALVDIRNYKRLGKRSAFATRLYGFTSHGLEPRRTYHGGSWSFRGFSRREWYVPNILFMSNELRFPLIDRLLVGSPIGGLGFRSIRGALFYDTGAAWEDDFDGFVGSFGAGLRLALLGLITFRFDYSYTHDYKTIRPQPDFDFFFGWNF